MATKLISFTNTFPISLTLDEGIQIQIGKANRVNFIKPISNEYLIFIELAEDISSNITYVQLLTSNTVKISDIFPQRGIQIQIILFQNWIFRNDFLGNNTISKFWISQSAKLKDNIQSLIGKAAGYQNDKLAFVVALYSLLNELKNANHLAEELPDSDQDKIHEVTKLLSSNFAVHPPTASDLALKVGISVSKLKTLFKKIHGESLYQYHQRAKLSYAADLLRTQRYTVSQVSYKVGYSHPIKFIKIFEKYYGTTPGKYKNE